jgi:opacity protein-like surface antigen
LFVFANLWKDFGAGFIRPYIGGGLGFGVADVDSGFASGAGRLDDTGVGFATQLGAGVRVPVTDRLTFDIGYRFRALANAHLNDNDTYIGFNAATSVFSHTAQAGFTYAIGDPVHTLAAPNSDPLDSLWYVSLFGGLSSPQDTADDYYNYIYLLNAKDGFTVGGAVGTYVAPSLRGELEIAYSRHAFDSYSYFGGLPSVPLDGRQAQLTFLLNFWKEFHVFDLTPYIGGGVGAGLDIWDDVTLFAAPDNGTGIGLATQFGFGVRYALTPSLTVDAGYRFRSVSGSLLVIDGAGAHDRVSTTAHIFQTGLTYAFGNAMSVAPVADYDPGGRTFYVSLFGGAAVPEDAGFVSYGLLYAAEMKDGFTLGMAVGTDIVPGLRGELEVSYLRAQADAISISPLLPVGPASGDAEQLFVLTNLWKDIDLGLPVTPYLGGGVGLVVVDNEIGTAVASPNDMTVASAGQLGAGLRFAVTQELSVDVGYRFKAAFDVITQGNAPAPFPHSQFSFYTHVFQAGVSWDF